MEVKYKFVAHLLSIKSQLGRAVWFEVTFGGDTVCSVSNNFYTNDYYSQWYTCKSLDINFLK